MPRPPHPLPTSGPPSSIANTPFLLKQTSPIVTSSPASFLLVDVSSIVGQAFPPNNRDVVSDFGSHPISRTLLPCSAIIWLRFARVKLLPMPPLPYIAIICVFFVGSPTGTSSTG